MARNQGVCGNCGTTLTFPLPSHCPQCKHRIRGVRQSVWPTIFPILFVGTLFAVLAGALWFLTQ
ncbi:MAG: hypothetical protein N2C14_03150 [Planctomycetales bacterium]